ncbi:MAG TPA: DEAD/DEAH box helicase, partial [Thermoanaerobaculia bacterium]
MPPLDRLQHYVSVLDRERGKHAHLPASQLVAEFEEVKPRVARDDFRAMNMPLEGTIDLHAVYWEVRRWRNDAERETLATTEVVPVVPGEDEIFELVMRARAAPASTGMKGGAAARLADLAFETAAENRERFLLGHGAMRTGRTAYPHQVKTAKKFFETMHGVGIVADEVGLGKTIVAGLVIEELLSLEPDAHVLILVPPNLRGQWGDQTLADFFGRPLAWKHGKEALRRAAFDPVVLFSLDEAKGDGKDDALATTLLQRNWDLLVVDEAHDCRNADSIRFRFVYALQARRRLFLTATPLHNSGYDMFTLATLLKPGCLGSRSAFAARYMDGERVLKDSEGLQHTLEDLMTRTLRRESGLRAIPRKIKSIKVSAFKEEERALYDELLLLLRTIYRRHMGASAQVMRPSARPQYLSQFVLIAMLVLREMASHPRAAIHTLQTALRRKVKELATITRDDADLARLDDFIARYTAPGKWDVAHHAKSERLLLETDELLRTGAKFIVFVNYLKTHQIIAELLAERHPGVKVLSYEGSLAPRDKTRIVQRFMEPWPPSCLVSTDAAGQGLDLQAANCVINYDFPWNPMRVEQRIGRIDRSSQESGELRILNFSTLGTVEEYVQI